MVETAGSSKELIFHHQPVRGFRAFAFMRKRFPLAPSHMGRGNGEFINLIIFIHGYVSFVSWDAFETQLHVFIRCALMLPTSP